MHWKEIEEKRPLENCCLLNLYYQPGVVPLGGGGGEGHTRREGHKKQDQNQEIKNKNKKVNVK